MDNPLPRLLVSVRSAVEAIAALEGGADLIDVKEPANGALGRAPDDVIRAVLDAAHGWPISVALGELRDDLLPPMAGNYQFAKWGLAGLDGKDWPALLAQRQSLLPSSTCGVVVAYADQRRAKSPSLADVSRHAFRQKDGVMLVDTFVKDGSTLLDWLSLEVLRNLCAEAKAAGIRVALAGSLGLEDIGALCRTVKPHWVAVRGAACGGGDRKGAVDVRQVRRLKAAIRES